MASHMHINLLHIGHTNNYDQYGPQLGTEDKTQLGKRKEEMVCTRTFKPPVSLWDNPATQKPLQLLQARINSGDHPKSVETKKLDEVPENEFNCLGSCNEINHQKRIAEE